MAFDPKRPLQQAKVPAGSILCRSGDPLSMLYLLHSGEVWYTDGTTGHKIIALGAGASPGFAQLIKQEAPPFTIITKQECVMSAFPVQTGNFSSAILGKLNVGMLSTRSIAQELISLQKVTALLEQLNRKVQSISDNLSIVLYRANPDAFPKDLSSEQSSHDLFLQESIPVIRNFLAASGDLPDPLNAEWLNGDLSTHLKKNYGLKKTFVAADFNLPRRLLALPADLQGEIFKKDVHILQELANHLATLLGRAFVDYRTAKQSLDENLKRLLTGEYCIVEKFKQITDVFSSGIVKLNSHDLLLALRFVDSMGTKILSNYQSLTGVPFKGLHPSFESLRLYIKGQIKSQPAAERAQTVEKSPGMAGVSIETVMKELAGSPMKIMNFLGCSSDEIRGMLKELNELRAMPNPLDSVTEVRKVRRSISRRYMDLYESAILKYKQNQNLPVPVMLMMQYGFFDDEFLDKEHLLTLFQLKDATHGKRIYPIHSGYKWIDLVGNRTEPPSVDEMGQTFFEKLKNDNKDKGWRRETDLPDEFNTYEYRTKYETKNFLDTNIRLTTGSPSTAFPILTKYQITIPLEKCLITRDRLSAAIDKLLSIDFSAFHREVIINDEEAGILKEFVQEQVIPNFILVPSIGTRAMMWQDLSSRNKNSTGRIALPIFATADLFTLLLEAVGAFRWELTKTVQGADWNNVSIPSITADFTDYVQFYKKNRDLSPEIKEKLSIEFKRFRTDRDRFINDYINWVKFESEGVLKLNKVCRAIFYRHIPFARDLRDKISNQPAYAELHNRFTNISNRKVRELEVKYRKYGEQLPKILQNNIDFYKV